MRVTEAGRVVIPELEEIAAQFKPRNVPWTPAEDEILRRYFNKVPHDALMKYLPNHTWVAAKDRATRIGWGA